MGGAIQSRWKSTLSAVYTYERERKLLETNSCRDVFYFAVTLGHSRWMSDAGEDKLRSVLYHWIEETPEDCEMTRLQLREHHSASLKKGRGLRRPQPASGRDRSGVRSI